MTINTS